MRTSCITQGDVARPSKWYFLKSHLINNLSIALILILFLCSLSTHAAKIIELTIKGPIGPATADYVTRGLSNAQNADLILILLDTPGGLDEATRDIIQQFLSSKVPIVTYVSPTGARAASAGTYLLYASTVAAMSPGTELGAASPVNIDGGNSRASSDSTMHKKITNDAKATIRSLAQLRGRDPIFAEKAVEDAVSITSKEALQRGVINYIAVDVKDLLAQLNGVTVIQNNKKIVLNTSDYTIEPINPDWRLQFLSVITNPTVAYLLMLLGIYGIFFELFNPGFVLPGVIGAVALLFALYALQLLPINYAAFGLIICGIAFIIAEGFTPSFGVLGLGGTAAFVLGSIMLMNTDSAVYQIASTVIWSMALVNIMIFIILVGAVVKSRQRAVQNGLIMLVGATGRALADINLEGQAVIRGEIWSVQAKSPIQADKNIKVVHASGLLLEVEEDFGAE